MKVVALLPLKANSTRVKGKNFRELAGKPLYRWMLDTLLSIDEINAVVINTDAKDILIEKGLPADARLIVRERRADLCGDEVSMNRIIGDDIEAISADVYIMTHTTNPLLTSDTIKKALSLYTQGLPEYDSVFSVNRHQARFYREDAAPINHDLNNLIPTQNLEPWYEENSCLYIFSKESFSAANARIGVCPRLFATAKIESVDIDEQEDWDLAEALANMR